MNSLMDNGFVFISNGSLSLYECVDVGVFVVTQKIFI